MSIGYVGTPSGSAGPPPLDRVKPLDGTKGQKSNFMGRVKRTGTTLWNTLGTGKSEKESPVVQVKAADMAKNLEKSVEGEKSRRANQASAFFKATMTTTSSWMSKRLGALKEDKKTKTDKKKQGKEEKKSAGGIKQRVASKEMGEGGNEHEEEKGGQQRNSRSEAVLKENKGGLPFTGVNQHSSIHEETEERIAYEAMADRIGLKNLQFIRHRLTDPASKELVQELRNYYLEQGGSSEELIALMKSSQTNQEDEKKLIRLMGLSCLRTIESEKTANDEDRPPSPLTHSQTTQSDPISKEEVPAELKTKAGPTPRNWFGVQRTEINLHSFSQQDQSFKDQLADEIGVQSLKFIRQELTGSPEEKQAQESRVKGLIRQLRDYYLEKGGNSEGFAVLIASSETNQEAEKEVIRLLGEMRLNYLEKSLKEEYVLDAIRQSYASGKALTITLKGTQDELIIKPSGKVYLKLKILGEGGFKATSQVVRIANISSGKLSTTLGQPIYKAYSPLTVSGDEEADIHQHLIDHLNQVYEAQKEASESSGKPIKSKAELREELFGQVAIGTSVFASGKNMGVLNEMCHGDVDSLLEAGNLTFPQRLEIALLMVKGISQLHAVGIIHRDLNTTNFLFKYKLDANGKPTEEIANVKVTDFGLSTIITGTKRSHTENSIPIFFPPEWVNDDAQFNPASDVYHFGVLLYQLVFGIPREPLCDLFPNFDKHKELMAIKQKPAEWPHMKEWESEDTSLKDLIVDMLSPNPDARPTKQKAIAVLEELMKPAS